MLSWTASASAVDGNLGSGSAKAKRFVIGCVDNGESYA